MSLKIFRTLATGLLVLSLACQTEPQNPQKESEASGEARDDSIALAHAYQKQARVKASVHPLLETQPIAAQSIDDAADDPAIWFNSANPESSLIYGSNKKGGLACYDLNGHERSYYPIGKVNNVDIVQEFALGSETISLLGCSNRSTQTLDLFRIMPADGAIVDLSHGRFKVSPHKIDDIYGFCFGRLANGRTYALLNGKNGFMQQYEIIASDSGLNWVLRREHQFPSQTEGMVVDELLGDLYVGEEGGGIWKLKLDPQIPTSASLITNSSEENPQIAFDIEGLSIYRRDKEAYLMASSQGNFSYAIFDLTPQNHYLTSIKIMGKEGVDGVEETDGLALISDSLNESFPAGLLIVQDGFNYEGDSIMPQNFKLVDWRLVAEVLSSQE